MTDISYLESCTIFNHFMVFAKQDVACWSATSEYVTRTMSSARRNYDQMHCGLGGASGWKITILYVQIYMTLSCFSSVAFSDSIIKNSQNQDTALMPFVIERRCLTMFPQLSRDWTCLQVSTTFVTLIKMKYSLFFFFFLFMTFFLGLF